MPGQDKITGLAIGLAVSGMLNLVLLVDRIIRRRKIFPAYDVDGSPTKPKPKKVSRKAAKAAAKAAEEEAAAKEAAEKEAEEKAAQKEADLSRGAAWSGDVAGLSMMEQAAAFASKGNVLEMTPRKVETAPTQLPPVAPRGTTGAPYTGVTKVAPPPPAFAQFTRAVSKRQNVPALRLREPSSRPYRVGEGASDPASQPATCQYGMRSPVKKNPLLAFSKGASGAAAPLPAPPRATGLNVSTITSRIKGGAEDAF